MCLSFNEPFLISISCFFHSCSIINLYLICLFSCILYISFSKISISSIMAELMSDLFATVFLRPNTEAHTKSLKKIYLMSKFITSFIWSTIKYWATLFHSYNDDFQILQMSISCSLVSGIQELRERREKQSVVSLESNELINTLKFYVWRSHNTVFLNMN